MGGLLGSICISIAVMTPGFVPNAGLDRILPVRWFRNLVLGDLYLGRVFMLAGLILLIGGWLRLRPAVTPRVPHAAILALWSLPMLLAPTDLLQRRLPVRRPGLDPASGPGSLPDRTGPGRRPPSTPTCTGCGAAPPRSTRRWPCRSNTSSSVRPAIPATCRWSRCGSRRSSPRSSSPSWCPRLARLLRVDPELAKWMAVLNPMLLLHYIGGAHNDALMAAGVLLACYLTYRFGRPGGC